MADDKFFYAKSGFAPYSDGSGFRVEVTVEKETEESDPTISIETVWRLDAHEWIKTARKIERMLDLVSGPPRPVPSVGKSPDPK